MVVKAVIFDLDGTITEFNLDFKTVRVEARQFLVKNGVPGSILDINESIFEMLKKVKVFLRNSRNTRNTQKFLHFKEKILSIASTHELKAAHETSLLSGVVETLNSLRKAGLKLAIFTINGEKSTDIILKRLRLNKFFDVVITRDSVEKVKPDSEHLEVTIKALDCMVNEVIVVGDSVTDMNSARAVNIIGIGIASNPSKAKRLIQAGAGSIISSMAELPKLISRINNDSKLGRVKEVQDLKLQKADVKRKARLRTRGPYRKAHIQD